MEEFSLHTMWYDSIHDILDDIPFTKRTNKGSLSEVASVFDIEATSFYENGEKRATMYAWVFGINGKCIRGRTWEEFIQVTKVLQSTYDLSPKKRFIIYVHNLSYEFQWFKDLFEWEINFSLDTRKPIYAITKSGIEFRCSYMLSGYSLATVSNNLNKYKVSKLVGDLDYRLIRHSLTPLTEKEWGYILNDGLVVMAYIQEELERLGSIKKLPFTKTGYVRNLCRNACFKGSDRYNFYKTRDTLTLTEESYKQFKRTYMGGFTHANARKVNKIIYNVSSYDFTSSYPAVMLSERYPMSKPMAYKLKDLDDFKHMIHSHCCIFDCRFNNIESTVTFEHYISLSRCLEYKNEVTDNGRIVEADMITVALTEQDFLIIEQMYKWDSIEIMNFHYFFRGYLPRELVKTTLDLYVNKTTLKGVIGKEIEYQVSKGMINAIYGMTVTDPCKEENRYDNENGWIKESKSTAELIETYNNSKSRFLYYAWGVWITAYARRNLFSGILECKDDYIYADTDSVKIINREKHLKYFEEYNKNIKQKIKECLQYHEIPLSKASPKTIKGVSKPLGVWDYEGTYQAFKTLGAKRYIYIDNNELHITIAGVNKKSGAEYLKYKFKTNEKILKNFTNNLSFPAEYEDKCKKEGKWEKVVKNGAGKLCHTYLDNHIKGQVIDYLGNVGAYDELSAVHMEPVGYDLSLEKNFIAYLLGIEEDYE